MSLRSRLARLLLLGVLEIGAVFGVPMSPQQIEELMNVMHRTEIVMKQEQSDL